MSAHLLVGDGHYRGAPGEADRWGRLLEKVAAERITELSILGDLFELWLAVDEVMPAWQHDMLGPLSRLRDAGITLRYVIGNKDYFVAEWNRTHQLFNEVIDGTKELESPAGPLLVAHGDLVNRADRQYRAWRALSRSAPVRASARALPRAWLRRLGEDLSRRLEKTNHAHKSYFPESELEARAREIEGPATQVYGHFHIHRELQVGDVRVITLPFLATENAGVLVSSSGFHRWEA